MPWRRWQGVGPTPSARPDARPTPPPAAAVARFRGDVEALTGPIGDRRLGLAVSGGPDSMAMLALAQAAFPGRVAAATVDHRLRSAAAAEAAFVAAQCAALGVGHAILPLEDLGRGNVSAAARVARYARLDGWVQDRQLDWLLTAHHADDQLETIVMRLNRASGVGGLAGVRARTGRVIRPLLGWRRAELAAIVAATGSGAITDPSNTDDRYDRARIRKILASVEWLDAGAVSRSAAALAAADAALAWTVARLRAERLTVAPAGGVRYDAAGLPSELARRALVDCLRHLDATAAPRGEQVDRLLATLTSDGVMTIGRVRCHASGGGKCWSFAIVSQRAHGGESRPLA